MPISNPFDPEKDSEISICVDATRIKDSDSYIRLDLDISGDGTCSRLDTKSGSSLDKIVCFDIVAHDFQLVVKNGKSSQQDVEVAVVWSSSSNNIL